MLIREIRRISRRKKSSKKDDDYEMDFIDL